MWKLGDATSWGTFKYYLKKWLIGFFKEYPIFSQHFLFEARRFDLQSYFKNYTRNPLTLNNGRYLLFTVCYLLGFFGFLRKLQSDFSIPFWLIRLVLMIYVLSLAVLRKDSLLHILLTFAYWMILLNFALNFGLDGLFSHYWEKFFQLILLVGWLRPCLHKLLELLFLFLVKNLLKRVWFSGLLIYFCPGYDPEFVPETTIPENLHFRRDFTLTFLIFVIFPAFLGFRYLVSEMLFFFS